MEPFLDSTQIAGDGAELALRMRRDGYLFIRGLLPRETLEHLRIVILGITQEEGWIKKDTPLSEAIADLDSFSVEPEPKYQEVYHRIYGLQTLHALQHHRQLIQLFERLLGEIVLPHPRIIGRIIFPQRKAYTTPAHQDFIPIQGTSDTYTAWIPLSTLPPEMGGLQIASGSHRHGIYKFRPSLGAGGMEITEPLCGWVSNPFEQGDVLVFHSMTVHKGIPCTGQRLRLSIDARYQKLSDPIAPDSLEPHGKLISWEKVYTDWPPSDLRYYWRKWDLRMKEYDSRYYDKRDRLAFEMASQDDRRAISALQRIVMRDPDPGKRRKAEQLLARLAQ